jgi:hypothetical protein
MVLSPEILGEGERREWYSRDLGFYRMCLWRNNYSGVSSLCGLAIVVFFPKRRTRLFSAT